MTVQQLHEAVKSGTLKQMHTSYTRGYVSRKSDGVVAPYSGRFGKGYTLRTTNTDSTWYCYVTYFIETAANAAN